MLQADVASSITYDRRLVALSIAIAVVASYTALDLAGRVTQARSRARLAWLIGGAIVMGIGIWSMHFVAMLAFSPPMPMSYDMLTVLLSMLPAIVASLGSLFLASRLVLSMWELLICGVLMGIGIATMHYIGMAAMRMEATTRYDPVLFALSVAIAIGASIVGLWIAFQLRVQSSSGERLKIGSAIVMGVAIAGMHYTGMAAATFIPTNPTASGSSDAMNGSLASLGVAIGTATFVILGFALMASFVDRRLAHSAKLLVQLEDSLKRTQLFTEITLRIRRSLKLEDILQTTVNEVRSALTTDRVIIYRFNSNGSGTIIAESVAEGWTKTLGKIVHNSLLENNIEMYRNGQVIATSDVYKAGFTDFYTDTLRDFQINASLVAPILNNNHEISGLLCVHQCSGPRAWHKSEIDLLRQLAIQVGIALEQASLLDEAIPGQKLLQLQGRAIAAAKVAIFITNSQQPDNPIIFCNQAFETITGYSPQEAIGSNYQFLTGSDTDPATVEKLHNAMRDFSEGNYEIKNYRKEGTEFWCELTVSPVRDAFGRVINFIGVLSDITQRKQAQEELRCSFEALQSELLELISNLKEASRGNLTVSASATNEVKILADFFNATIESLRQIVSQVKQAAHQINAYAVENQAQIQQLADRSPIQVEEITRTLEEVNQMNLSIQTVADSASFASVVARTASDTASSASSAIDSSVNSILNLQQTVAQTANKVKSLGESSQKISALGARINEIARETNLLVIDASTEATWLGDRGRGFAAVVEQIGQLAVQATVATKEIELLCTQVKSETSVAVKTIELGTTQVVEKANLVLDAKLSLGQILEVSHQIDRLAQSISTTTVSQAQTSDAVLALLKQIAQVLENTADSSLIVSALQQIQEVARQLQTSVSQFKTDA